MSYQELQTRAKELILSYLQTHHEDPESEVKFYALMDASGERIGPTYRLELGPEEICSRVLSRAQQDVDGIAGSSGGGDDDDDAPARVQYKLVGCTLSGAAGAEIDRQPFPLEARPLPTRKRSSPAGGLMGFGFGEDGGGAGAMFGAAGGRSRGGNQAAMVFEYRRGAEFNHGVNKWHVEQLKETIKELRARVKELEKTHDETFKAKETLLDQTIDRRIRLGEAQQMADIKSELGKQLVSAFPIALTALLTYLGAKTNGQPSDPLVVEVKALVRQISAEPELVGGLMAAFEKHPHIGRSLMSIVQRTVKENAEQEKKAETFGEPGEGDKPSDGAAEPKSMNGHPAPAKLPATKPIVVQAST